MSSVGAESPERSSKRKDHRSTPLADGSRREDTVNTEGGANLDARMALLADINTDMGEVAGSGLKPPKGPLLPPAAPFVDNDLSDDDNEVEETDESTMYLPSFKAILPNKLVRQNREGAKRPYQQVETRLADSVNHGHRQWKEKKTNRAIGITTIVRYIKCTQTKGVLNAKRDRSGQSIFPTLDPNGRTVVSIFVAEDVEPDFMLHVFGTKDGGLGGAWEFQPKENAPFVVVRMVPSYNMDFKTGRVFAGVRQNADHLDFFRVSTSPSGSYIYI